MISLADLPRNMSLLLLLSFLGHFSKLYLSKFAGTFHLREFELKAISGSRNRAPPLFCSSNVLCFSSSVELNLEAAVGQAKRRARLGCYEAEAKIFKGGGGELVKNS